MTATRSTAHGRSLATSRSLAYKYARRTGDLQAILSGDPNRIAKRLLNKEIGRHIVPKLWVR